MKQKIKNLLDRFSIGFSRFPNTTILFTILAIASICFIIFEDFNENLEMALAMSALVSLLTEISNEYEITKAPRLPIIASSVVIPIVYFALRVFNNIYVYTAISSIGIAIVGLIFYILYYDRENKLVLSHLVKSHFLCGLATGIVFAGVVVCITAFYFLICRFSDIWKAISIFAVLIVYLANYLLFISFIPKPQEKIEVPKVYRVIIHKALFYVYLALIAILYLYILKVIVTWKMPVGRFNWYGCFSLLFFVFFFLTVDEYDGAVQKKFKEYGAYGMVPILIMQFVGIYIRISNYGLTTPRYMSIILVIIAIVFMLFTVIKYPVNYAFLIASALVFLFASVPGMNIYDAPNRDQENRLRTALTKSGIYANGTFNDIQISEEYEEIIKSAYDYLKHSEGDKSDFFEQFSNDPIAERFGAYSCQEKKVKTFHFSGDVFKNEFDVSKYRTINYLRSYDFDKSAYEEIINDYLRTLKDDKDYYGQDYLVIKLTSMEDLYLDYLYFEINEDTNEIEEISWTGYIMRK